MGIREAFALQTRADGLVFPLNDPNTRNGLRWFCHKHLYLILSGQATVEDRLEFVRVVDSCEIEPGLFKRSPTDAMQITTDDMIPLALVSYLYGTHHAKDMVVYGRKHLWFFNSEKPGKRTWSSCFAREPQFIAHLIICGNEMPNLFLRFYWAGDILLSAVTKRSDQDGQIFSWMLILASKGKALMFDDAASFWMERFRIDWPGGIKEVMTKYVGNNAEDALAKYAIYQGGIR